MKKIILALLAATSLASAVPAAAQPVQYGPYNPFAAREANDARRIQWCVRTGGMSSWEARRLFAELRSIEALSGHWLTPRMRYYIAQRLARLEAEIRAECHVRLPHPIYEQEYNRFPHPDPGPYRGHDRFDGYERGNHRPGYDGRFDGGPHDGRGQREILQVR